jgi:adenine-specific DNA-methyltransferase
VPKNQTKRRTRVETTVHDEAHRTNIPTTELGSFLDDEEKEPKAILYPRDPSLDPQLVWKGKDEQDRHPLEVPAVPIYIQEKIHPKALIEALRAEKAGAETQLNLWADFNGIQLGLEELVKFYQHEQHWSNRLILGDSLLVMNSLAEKEGLKGQVQMIYIDPPYGIKFGSNWQVSTRKRDVRDGKAEDATRQPEQVKAFRDTWELGIHSYLSYLRDRLVLARDLLSDSGSVFVQIGEDNVHLVRCLMDEVFGSEQRVASIVVEKTSGLGMEYLDQVTDYILWYARRYDSLRFRPLYLDKRTARMGEAYFRFLELADGTRRPLKAAEAEGEVSPPPGARRFTIGDLTSQTQAATTRYVAEFRGRKYESGKRQWATPPSGMQKLIWAHRVEPRAESIGMVRYFDDFPVVPLRNVWTDTGTGSFTDPKVYVVQTGVKVVERCILLATDPGDLVLDPTCGGGTTAIASEKWGRRWITIDTSRVALALTRQRLMAAKLPYYTLADSSEGARILGERSGDLQPTHPPATDDVRKGFVYRTVPHVTLKSIVNNPDIHDGMTRQEIDATIARHADQEVLYDQPYEDKKVVRVTGPFTVESLSPHITLPLSEAPADDGRTGPAPGDDDVERFQRVVLDHLRKAGVQNTVRSERLMFDSIEPWPGRYVHAVGTYSENGVEKRAAVSIGPEYGTVDAELVHQAAREAVDFADLLIVCGFAFDGYIAGEFRKLGRLTILKAAMNPDLAMGDELLKKTGSGNLFMVFGEPDIEARTTSDGLWEIEVRGVDVYNPTTGEIRSHSTDDIACWFIDTSYDGNSFFVRHAYFCGGNEPYESLKRALRADIDEEAWSSLYRTTSLPFPVPETGRIAVKVINHYGDEVMKVLEVKARPGYQRGRSTDE